MLVAQYVVMGGEQVPAIAKGKLMERLLALNKTISELLWYAFQAEEFKEYPALCLEFSEKAKEHLIDSIIELHRLREDLGYSREEIGVAVRRGLDNGDGKKQIREE